MRLFITILVMLSATMAFADQRSSLYLLTRGDADSLYGGFQSALRQSADNHAVDWTNSSSGLSGSTTPLKTYFTSSGLLCRDYLSSVQLDGAIQQAFGTACRQSDGRWTVAGERLIERSQPSMKFVYVQQPRKLVTQNCPYASMHPTIERSQKRHPRQNFHSEQFHEKLKMLEPNRRSIPKQQEIQQQEPTKFLKLVSY